MPRQKRQPPKNTIIIGFSVFCTSCADELREATPDDHHGDLEYCEQCGTTVPVAVGVSVNANTIDEIKYTMREMQRNLPLIHTILSRWNPPSASQDSFE
jgi:hypothetical protein